MILFSQTASWISLDESLGFTNKIKEIIRKAPPPTASLIGTGFDLIKGAILGTKMKKDQINNLEVVVISNFANDVYDEDIEKMKSILNITYWNISQNITIPKKEKDVKYIGGQVSLKEFITNERPIETIKTILSNPRYDKIRNMFTNLVRE
jgi:hypothetical protein